MMSVLPHAGSFSNDLDIEEAEADWTAEELKIALDPIWRDDLNYWQRVEI